jgi:hypothetical protein
MGGGLYPCLSSPDRWKSWRNIETPVPSKLSLSKMEQTAYGNRNEVKVPRLGQHGDSRGDTRPAFYPLNRFGTLNTAIRRVPKLKVPISEPVKPRALPVLGSSFHMPLVIRFPRFVFAIRGFYHRGSPRKIGIRLDYEKLRFRLWQTLSACRATRASQRHSSRARLRRPFD